MSATQAFVLGWFIASLFCVGLGLLIRSWINRSVGPWR